MNIFDIGMLIILVTILVILLYISKYSNFNKFPKLLRQGEVTPTVVFTGMFLLNFEVLFFMLSKINFIFISRQTGTIDILVLVVGSIICLLLVSLLVLIEMDNIILRNEETPYTVFFDHVRRVIFMITIVLAIYLIFLVYNI